MNPKYLLEQLAIFVERNDKNITRKNIDIAVMKNTLSMLMNENEMIFSLVIEDFIEENKEYFSYVIAQNNRLEVFE